MIFHMKPKIVLLKNIFLSLWGFFEEGFLALVFNKNIFFYFFLLQGAAKVGGPACSYQQYHPHLEVVKYTT